jgi:methyl-CpG-binding domain protein 4
VVALPKAERRLAAPVISKYFAAKTTEPAAVSTELSTAAVTATAWPVATPTSAPALAGASSPRSQGPAPSDFDGGVARGVRLALAARGARAAPPRSPFGLLEEILWHDEHKLLVACLLLNVTTRAQVDVVLWRLFRAFPTARELAAATADARANARLERILRPLGLHRKRARRLALMSRDWLAARGAHEGDGGQWAEPLPTATVAALYGVGDYTADAHELFVLGRADEARPPRDHALRWYHAWALQRREP